MAEQLDTGIAPEEMVDGVPVARLPIVAVVGRPNVGKSTLVNRIVGRRATIVEEHPGVTRDRKELVAEWAGHNFRIVDTGGWLKSDEALAKQITYQAERAIAEADVILFVVDVTVGTIDEDAQVARVLQRAGKPVLLVANKVDDPNRENDVWEFIKLGLGDPYPVSAIHGRQSGDLLDALVAVLPEDLPVEPPVDDGTFSIAIVGRPNVGKSTLFNRMVGDDRSVVHDMPGTTMDTIDTIVETPDGPLRFVDTAGMRRQSRVEEQTEYTSVVRALNAVDQADAALLVIDASQGVAHQDQRLGERIDAAGTAVVIVLNKWDLIETEEREQVIEDVADRLSFLGYAQILKLSALDEEEPPARPARIAGRGGGVPLSGPDRRAQPGDQDRAGASPTTARRSAPPSHPVRDPGCDRPADVHAVHDPPAPADLPALRGAHDPRDVLARADAGEDPRPPPGRVSATRRVGETGAAR